eukprot:Clim_evm19s156 gene=Clim_evmTU19s156
MENISAFNQQQRNQETSQSSSWISMDFLERGQSSSGTTGDVTQDDSWWGKLAGTAPPPQEQSFLDRQCLSLSRFQRLVACVAFLIFSATSFGAALVMLPTMVLAPRKFVLLFTFGSLFAMCSFAFLYGPTAYIKHLMEKDKLPFTIAFIVSLVATLYFAMGMQSTILTLISSVVEIGSLTFFVMSYLPGGTAGARAMFGTVLGALKRMMFG